MMSCPACIIVACLEGESGLKGGDVRNKTIAVEGGVGYLCTAQCVGPCDGGVFGRGRGWRAVSLWGWGLFFLVLDVQLDPAVGPVAVCSTHPGCQGAQWGAFAFPCTPLAVSTWHLP